jgi:hypothetical protein
MVLRLARTRTVPTSVSEASMAVAVWLDLCGSMPMVTVVLELPRDCRS